MGAGIRPATTRLVEPRFAQRVAAPSYDTLDPARRRELAEREPLNWVNAMQTPADHGGDHDAALAANRRAVDRILEQGAFGPELGPRFAWYRLTAGDHEQTGLVAEVDVAGYADGRILRHEATRTDRERELAAYLRQVGVASSPVALAHPPRPQLRALARNVDAESPALDMRTPDGVRHTVWTIDDPAELAAVQAATTAVTRTWIVDGHHRLAAAASSATDSDAEADAPQRWVLAVLFPFDELRILSFHRVVALDASPTEIRSRLTSVGRLSPLTDVEVLATPGAFAVCLEGTWHRLDLDTPAPAAEDVLAGLDVVALQDHVLRPALGIDEPRTDRRLRHLAGDLTDLAAACAAPGVVGFAVRPVAMEQLAAVAASGAVLPPKSTRFDPKVRSGLFLRHVH